MHAVFLDLQTFSIAGTEATDNNATSALEAIKGQVTKLSCYRTTAPEQVLERCQEADIVISNKVVLDKAILSRLPRLKLICIAATGSNNIDIAAARTLGIAVTNVSGYAGASVAQYVFAQILEYFNQTSHHNRNTELGLWQQNPTFCLHGNAITELAGKTLGIIGYGNLGRSVAKIATAFDIRVLVAERANAESIRPGRCDFNHLLRHSDIISLHCPLTPKTDKLLDEHSFKQMKTNALVINTARGGLIDNRALLTALKNKEIACAVLDVLDQEPPPADHPLLTSSLDNLKITGHIAWASEQAQQRLLDAIADNIRAFKAQKRLNRLD
ncbi:D-2-hydroxyacid dehydrogenase [Thalassomonas viridans]|uniref:D-2-hydroxyacid dehydrogenase n=1 Tax=Thalassomonas viridans TaxID=137584 RepID=A0AAF0C8B3_9GAMM|nr:D-2-hydroxyacid dehydrogenase [Thalassomonas viridans]WDE06237.1 D-2-hydroxyacid dehydrogenase [Thalassomonas viridans]